MIELAGTLLLAASLTASPISAQPLELPRSPLPQAVAQPFRAAKTPLSLLDVPYVSQSEALCGGAAAAMVMRYWGAIRVAAEDFAPLVDDAAAGIRTSTLTRAIHERGYEAMAAAGTAALARAELADGRPVIALIEDRPGVFHYVVLVGWHDRAVVLHDPARTPYVLAEPADFERRWKPSGNWMLAVAPRNDAGRPPSAAPTDVTVSRPDARDSCGELVAEGVRLAQLNDLAGAERLLAGAAYECPGGAPLRELAGVRLQQRRWPEVRELAGRAVAIDPTDAHAWRLLATSRYIGGDHGGALEAWNRVGEPVVDLVSVSGLQRTSHRSVEKLLDVGTGVVLTRSGSERARRRLDELPAAASTRLEYLPRPAGTAEVRAHVVERHLVPRGWLTWTAIGLRSAATREVATSVVSLGHGGERLDARWRFWPRRPGAGLALHVPTGLGVFSLDVFSERQPFTDASLARAERLAAGVRLAQWVTETMKWEVSGGYARWTAGQGLDQTGRERFGTLGAAGRFEHAGWHLAGEVNGWIGGERFVRGAFQSGWRSSRARRGLVLDAIGRLEAIGTAAPLDIWPAGDTGPARQTLLRAHPVLDDGRLRLDRLGRRLTQATIEGQYWWRPFDAAPIGAALFVDAGRTSRRVPGPAVTDVDIGAGLRLAFPGRHGLFRADFAHGVRDGHTAISVTWTPGL